MSDGNAEDSVLSLDPEDEMKSGYLPRVPSHQLSLVSNVLSQQLSLVSNYFFELALFLVASDRDACWKDSVTQKNTSSQQLPLGLKFRGGKRKGAGRKNCSGERGHVKREVFHTLTPVHVTLKVRKDIPSLRKKKLFMAFKNAVIGAWGKGLKIQHYCLLSNHLHLIVEARDHKELESFFRSFCTRLSKQINKGRGERGRVLKDRYHVHLLKTPRETAHALRYVLTNEHKHLKKKQISMSPFCSNWCFEEFELLVQRSKHSALSSTTAYSADALDLCQFLLDPPRSWLLKKGWLRGLAARVGFASQG